jgi:hypothetical protein
MISSLFKTETADQQSATLIHEALHGFLNRGDAALANFLIPDRHYIAGNCAGDNAPSLELGRFLKNDCKKQ